MIFKLDHFFDDPYNSVFLEKLADPKNLGEEILKLIETVGCLQFRLEELIDENMSMNAEQAAVILQKYFGFRDVTEQFQPFIEETFLPEEEWDVFNEYAVGPNQVPVIQIDLYRARESCCGPDYAKLMSTRLPETEEFDRDVCLLASFYDDAHVAD
ncbi:hypothetical protein EQZ20_24535 (plasmid) [Bacillus glycinifermentans]|uniref:Uncharacterized protein n=1 Tax=Bacillus glycinifermentans TaxID=1664069 RepID=A0AAJ3Z327_9BACI|nr:hypothetical protein [Bacillus glycinifermentans]QAT68044.1 hypothetical protein EQZ20_24535 [Bacillus glycinifermentans]